MRPILYIICPIYSSNLQSFVEKFVLNWEMRSEQIAVCVIAYNEKQNIEELLWQVLENEQLKTKVFVFTDGSLDGTAEIVDKVANKYKKTLVHIKSKQRRGKQYAYNKLLKLVKNYRYTVFLDGDIFLEKNSLALLVMFIRNHPQYKVVGSFLRPVNISNSLIPVIYRKVKEHVFNNGVYKYFTGRAFVAVTKFLPKIPKNSHSDDFYLNLMFKTEEIGICGDSVVEYIIPHTTGGMFWYSYYIGSTMTDVRDNFGILWREQVRRISLWDYVVFGLTRRNFSMFWSKLEPLEKIIFIYSRIITMLGFVSGYLTTGYKHLWEPIKETKIRIVG